MPCPTGYLLWCGMPAFAVCFWQWRKSCLPNRVFLVCFWMWVCVICSFTGRGCWRSFMYAGVNNYRKRCCRKIACNVSVLTAPCLLHPHARYLERYVKALGVSLVLVACLFSLPVLCCFYLVESQCVSCRLMKRPMSSFKTGCFNAWYRPFRSAVLCLTLCKAFGCDVTLLGLCRRKGCVITTFRVPIETLYVFFSGVVA